MQGKLGLLMLLVVAWLSTGAQAQMSGGAAPRWTAVPGAPGVDYAPNLGQDIFRLAGKYYYLNQGKWYQGRHVAGPWDPLSQPPKAIYGVESQYFKSPPGWARGKKTGWGGDYLPPGQRKKLDKPLSPGQRKKYGYD